ncbi:primase-helicase family protein [Seohaeicola zhoushanensis]
MFPDANDRRILIEYLAHNVKYPGHKVPWAPLIQGAEGIGKNAIKKLMRHAIGKMYFYEPKAKQLNNSGSKFNGWMENKLFFMVDEIKTDENRDLVEVLKPFITEIEMEIEGKGSNQRMGDTPGNWLFFSNHKDAIPITKNGRRYCILYSPLQTVEDIAAAGMGQRYFDDLYSWLGDEANGGILPVSRL